MKKNPQFIQKLTQNGAQTKCFIEENLHDMGLGSVFRYVTKSSILEKRGKKKKKSINCTSLKLKMFSKETAKRMKSDRLREKN